MSTFISKVLKLYLLLKQYINERFKQLIVITVTPSPVLQCPRHVRLAPGPQTWTSVTCCTVVGCTAALHQWGAAPTPTSLPLNLLQLINLIQQVTTAPSSA